MTTIATYSVSVLNASYEGLGSTKLDRALNLVIHGKAEVIEYDESHKIRSVNGEQFKGLPKVIRLLKFVKVPFTYSEEYFSKEGVLRRDNFTCGYCGKTAADGVRLTHDHILPKSRGGGDNWMNAITACVKCNGKKDNKTPEEAHMPLLFEPTVPMRIYFRSDKPRHRKKRKY